MAASRTDWLKAESLAVCLVAATLSTGCMIFYDPVPYLSMARRNASDAPALTDWTLRQTRMSQVVDGVIALKLIAECAVDAPPRQRALAVLGLVKIADRRRTGWPDDSSSEYCTAETILERARISLAACESTRAEFEQQLENAASGASAAEWQRANDVLQRGFPPLEH